MYTELVKEIIYYPLSRLRPNLEVSACVYQYIDHYNDGPGEESAGREEDMCAVQWDLRIMDTLGMSILSFVQVVAERERERERERAQCGARVYRLSSLWPLRS